ncbi:hypothetical protein F5B20DRAFT_559884 [Whalleya microplaca]|nr:hypothetical protein F5B20DRAFT_559884 [Whalleya microplaca]
MLDYARNEIWPKLGQVILPNWESMGRAMFKAAAVEPLILYCTIWSAAAYHLTLSFDGPLFQMMLDLQCKASRKIRNAIATNNISDGILFGIQALSYQFMDVATGVFERGLFESPLYSLSVFNATGPIMFAPEHMRNQQHILIQRGGIGTVTLPGVAETFQMSDILNACHCDTAPTFELCRSYSLGLQEMTASRPSMARARTFRVDIGFKEILLDLITCCNLVESWYTIAETSLEMPDLPRPLLLYRDLVVYRLLRLPRGQEGIEICRLATFILTFGIVYPNYWGALHRMANDLVIAFMDPRFTKRQEGAFLFWAAMLGGMAILDESIDATQEFFIKILKDLRARLGLESWESAKLLLKKYVWIDHACDKGGMIIWEKIGGDDASVKEDLMIQMLLDDAPPVDLYEWSDGQ